MKWGWCGSTMDASQLDSGKVRRPPSPGAFPVSSLIRLKKVGSWKVVVKETHFDSSMWSVKVAGWPQSGWRAGVFSHKAQEPPSCLPLRAGGESIEPRLEDSVMDPKVTMTRSLSVTLISPVWPFCS